MPIKLPKGTLQLAKALKNAGFGKHHRKLILTDIKGHDISLHVDADVIPHMKRTVKNHLWKKRTFDSTQLDVIQSYTDFFTDGNIVRVANFSGKAIGQEPASSRHAVVGMLITDHKDKPKYVFITHRYNQKTDTYQKIGKHPIIRPVGTKSVIRLSRIRNKSTSAIDVKKAGKARSGGYKKAMSRANERVRSKIIQGSQSTTAKKTKKKSAIPPRRRLPVRLTSRFGKR